MVLTENVFEILINIYKWMECEFKTIMEYNSYYSPAAQQK